MKFLIVIGLIAVLGALASAGFFMLRKGQKSDGRDARMARALAVRVGVSVALFLLILLAYFMGWIQPTGVPMGH
ncbi:twin transmembrane helix small protein [Pelomonas sp. SE-A7]|uniref:twin transmembrane helix small protein n=1 Tax=Pelomonas sp. SE-A7 TaxID=3054953 RepID=UPI00259CC26A|nr:twin transmembrane helix small protein [Pelomonas sp. SE-A7]MDM4767583.1 twin transmembrane helix small protein [Pelomonas sp. SE-A7]